MRNEINQFGRIQFNNTITKISVYKNKLHHNFEIKYKSFFKFNDLIHPKFSLHTVQLIYAPRYEFAFPDHLMSQFQILRLLQLTKVHLYLHPE